MQSIRNSLLSIRYVWLGGSGDTDGKLRKYNYFPK